MGENSPQYVTCHCQHCDGHIEFDAAEFAEENSVVPCPHCDAATKLFIPASIPPPLPKKFTPPVAPIISRFEGFFSGTSPPPDIAPPAEASGIPLPSLTEEQINSIGDRKNDPLAAKLFAEGDQDVAVNFDDARRYVRDPRLKLMNPETGERFTPETLEDFIRAKRLQKQEQSPAPPRVAAPLPPLETSCSEPPIKIDHRLGPFPKGSSVTVTPKQSESVEGRELIGLLTEIGGEGFVTEEGLTRLHGWLEARSNSKIRAILYLLDLSRIIAGCKKLTTDARYEMQLAIERTLPKDVREPIKTKRQQVERYFPASEATLANIRQLGGNPRPGMTRNEAFEMENNLESPATENQVVGLPR